MKRFNRATSILVFITAMSIQNIGQALPAEYANSFFPDVPVGTVITLRSDLVVLPGSQWAQFNALLSDRLSAGCLIEIDSIQELGLRLKAPITLTVIERDNPFDSISARVQSNKKGVQNIICTATIMFANGYTYSLENPPLKFVERLLYSVSGTIEFPKMPER